MKNREDTVSNVLAFGELEVELASDRAHLAEGTL